MPWYHRVSQGVRKVLGLFCVYKRFILASVLPVPSWAEQTGVSAADAAACRDHMELAMATWVLARSSVCS